jgi:hypothetical protein
MVAHLAFGLSPDTPAVAMRDHTVIWIGQTTPAGTAVFASQDGEARYEISTLLGDDDPPPRGKPKLPVAEGQRGLQFDPRDGSLVVCLTERAEISVSVYDAAGRLVATPHDGELGAGEHRIAWGCRGSDGAALRASGIYFVRISAGAQRVTGRVLVLR